MIFYKCKNCKWYIPFQKDFKAILSKKTKTKYLDKGYCLYFYRSVKDDGWCERYERKTKKNDKHHVYNYTCPNCHTILSEVEDCNYCPNCGTELDWSQNEK